MPKILALLRLTVTTFATTVAVGASAAVDVDALWDIDQPAQGEVRLREAERGAQGVELLEIRAAIARSLMLQGQLPAAEQEIATVASMLSFGDDVGSARYLIERGRLSYVQSLPVAALLDFQNAFQLAERARSDALAVDAANMASIVTRADPKVSLDWLTRALALATASQDSRVARLLPALHNNLGWALAETGDCNAAMQHFHASANLWRSVGKTMQTGFAELGLAHCLRTSGNPKEALKVVEGVQTLANSSGSHALGGEVQEEIGEIRIALGDRSGAQHAFAAAASEFSRDPWQAENDPSRAEHLLLRSRSDAPDTR